MGLFDIKPTKPNKKSKMKIVSFAPKASKLKPSKSTFNIKPVSFIAKPNKPRMKNLIFGYDRPKPARKVTGKLNMSWQQAKIKFPKLSPFGDADKDGVQNWLDCKPFDKKFQAFGKFKSKPKKKNGYTEPEEFTAAKRFGGANIKRLKRIGSGRDRIVYQLDKDKVLKIARNVGGLRQNVPEKELDYILDHVKHYETGKDYVVMEKAGKRGKVTKAFLKKLKEAERTITDEPDEPLRYTLEKEGHSDILNYDFAKGDIAKKSSWGEIKGKPVLVDAGALTGSSLGEEHRITKVQQKLGRAREQKKELLERMKRYEESGESFDKQYLPKLNRDIEQMEMDIKDWGEIQAQRKVYKHKGKKKIELYEHQKERRATPQALKRLESDHTEYSGYGKWLKDKEVTKVKLDLNNEVDEPFEADVRETKETDSEKERRERSGYTKIKRVNAREFKRKFEEHTGESLDWNKERLSSALERNEDDAYPQVSKRKGNEFFPGDWHSVTDGRHRISAAAERDQEIDVAVLEDKYDFQAKDEDVDDEPYTDINEDGDLIDDEEETYEEDEEDKE